MRDDHDTEHRANDERHGPEEVPEPVYLLPVRDRGADAAEEGADIEVPDDGTVGHARQEELQERDGAELTQMKGHRSGVLEEEVK